MITVKQIENAVGHIADTVGKNRQGQIVIRRGYFFRNGCDSEKYANRISETLEAAGIKAKIVDSGEKWKPFIGGASTANSSHWYVILETAE